jgi:hypothetical protein
MKKTTKLTVRSLQELHIRYVRFCAQNSLSSDVVPEEQYVECIKLQMWLDSYIAQHTAAHIEGVRLARGRTDVVRLIASDVATRFVTPFQVNIKKAVKKTSITVKDNLNLIIDSVFIESKKHLSQSSINVCPSPSTTFLRNGTVQLGLNF